ncbi:LysM peptidoglycan-binding domain-containing protein [Cohnella pontilimi]|uniref:LysM peptidoglycan-binding domain-containing protein n=1 Tax=Cohnella pontilimi TaxID=2564100 RepID=A0A4U0FJ98_9BACL|nr:M14 family metallopeptidase [Cohnella pontilimi]TJY43542.1 LysM peptidoglycan-binding domain-containing protein [Cohnella pontilimi]
MNTVTYAACPGDTPRRIALRFGVSYASLVAVNPQWDEDPALIDGELVYVPIAKPRRYIVRQGDTWETIAWKADCSPELLCETNGLSPNAALTAGQWLELPAGRSGRIVAAEAEYGPMELSKDITRLTGKYPFVTAGSIGRSVLGKPLHALRIGGGPFRWHINAACHANEWITSLLLMRFAEDYANAYQRNGTVGGKSAAALFSRTTLWIVPMLNPDGVELVQDGLALNHPMCRELLEWNRGSKRFSAWKANARGVDLNDQFPAHWEEEQERRRIPGPAPRDYSGPAPLSEPEALSLAEWTERMDFHAVLALHTQGEEIYWNYRDREPPQAGEWAARLARAGGYRAVRLTGSDAGYKDWFIDRFRRPGFTVEAGWGHNPLPLEGFSDIYDGVSKLLAEALDLSP